VDDFASYVARCPQLTNETAVWYYYRATSFDLAQSFFFISPLCFCKLYLPGILDALCEVEAMAAFTGPRVLRSAVILVLPYCARLAISPELGSRHGPVRRGQISLLPRARARACCERTGLFKVRGDGQSPEKRPDLSITYDLFIVGDDPTKVEILLGSVVRRPLRVRARAGAPTGGRL